MAIRNNQSWKLASEGNAFVALYGMPITVPVANIAALRAITSANTISGSLADGDSVIVSYHTLSIDQGGGAFVWSPTSVLNDNNGTIIKPNAVSTTDPGRWLRLASLTDPWKMNVAWFGAVGYTRHFYGAATPFDPSTIDSIAAFQAANDALPEAVGASPTVSGRACRYGVIEIPTGQYWLSDDWYVSPQVRIFGQGFNKSYVIRMPNTAPYNGVDPAADERFVIRSEELQSPLNNNNFGNIMEDFSVSGYSFNEYENGNPMISGIVTRGAQGSRLDKVAVGDCGFRGIVNYGLRLQDVWIFNVTRGPGYHDFTRGFGLRHRNISCEHVNINGLYKLKDFGFEDPAIGLPNVADDSEYHVPAMMVDAAVYWVAESLQGENSPLELYMRSCIQTRVDCFYCETQPTFAKTGVILGGNSYLNAFAALTIITDNYTTKFIEKTAPMLINGETNFVRKPSDFNGTTQLRRVIEFPTNAAKLGYQMGSVLPGLLVKITGENDRIERFSGVGGSAPFVNDMANPLNWEVANPPSSLLSPPVASTPSPLPNGKIWTDDAGVYSRINGANRTLSFNNRANVSRTGSSYSLVLADGDPAVIVRKQHSGTHQIVVPNQATVAWPDDSFIMIRNAGSGVLSLIAGSGVTIHGASTVPVNTGVCLVRVSANEWDVY